MQLEVQEYSVLNTDTCIVSDAITYSMYRRVSIYNIKQSMVQM